MAERATSITERTGIPIGWASTIILTLAGGIGSLGVYATRIQNNTEAIAEMRESMNRAAERAAKSDLEFQLRLQRSEDNYARVMQSLGRVESMQERMASKLEQMSSKGGR